MLDLERFWKEVYEREFPAINKDSTGLSWRELYCQAQREHQSQLASIKHRLRHEYQSEGKSEPELSTNSGRKQNSSIKSNQSAE